MIARPPRAVPGHEHDLGTPGRAAPLTACLLFLPMADSTQTHLDAIDAAIAARLGGRPVDSYSIPGGPEITYMKLAELYDLRDRLRRERSRQTRNPFVRADLRT